MGRSEMPPNQVLREEEFYRNEEEHEGDEEELL